MTDNETKLYEVRENRSFHDGAKLHRPGDRLRWFEGSAALIEIDEATGQPIEPRTEFKSPVARLGADLSAAIRAEETMNPGPRTEGITAAADLATTIANTAGQVTAPSRNPLDRDGDGKTGGDLPEGYSLGEDGVSVIHEGSGRTWPAVADFRAWQEERRELHADLTALNVEFDPRDDDDALRELRDKARAARDAGIAGEVDIPGDWKTVHWTQRVKIAKAILGDDKAEVSGERAIEVIVAELERRGA